MKYQASIIFPLQNFLFAAVFNSQMFHVKHLETIQCYIEHFFHKENAKKNDIGGCSNNWRTNLCLLGNFSFNHKFLSSANYF